MRLTHHASVPSSLSAADFRRWAMQCASEVEDPGLSEEERNRLLIMRESLLQLAHNEDWLNGKVAR